MLHAIMCVCVCKKAHVSLAGEEAKKQKAPASARRVNRTEWQAQTARISVAQTD